MRKSKSIKFSKRIIEDMEIIAKHKHVKLSDWIKWLEYNFDAYIAIKKSKAIKYFEGKFILGKISNIEYKKITGYYAPKYLLREKETFQKDSEKYKENARNALLMNF